MTKALENLEAVEQNMARLKRPRRDDGGAGAGGAGGGVH
jgi:hypothetical protein